MRWASARLLPLALLSALPAGVLGGSILSTNGFSTCVDNPSIKLTNLDVTYNKDTRELNFAIAGESSEVQKVKAHMAISAYGKQIYEKSFNPCEGANAFKGLCPVPASTFSSSGQQQIPEEYASQIPAIAFTVPDLDGMVKLTLTNVDTGKDVGCVESTVGNGHTLNMPLISYVAAGIAAAALALSAVSALAAGGQPGAATSSPTFTEVIVWFQGMAVNGMMSVPYPQVYQSFTTNFAFSTGLVPWGSMQVAIDNFRAKTGGNVKYANYPYLKNNVTLVYPGTNATSGTSSSAFKRAVDTAVLFVRDGTQVNVDGQSAQIGGSGSGNSSSEGSSKDQHFVSGIQAYVEQLSIPQENTFMTILLVWAIVVAAIIVGVLLFKVILEAWSMCGKLPKSLESWRKRYWMRMAKAIVNLILMLYGMWTLYCIYQFTNGDSWAAKTLAAVTLSIFTLILGWFTWRIWSKAREYKRLDGDASRLYEDKDTWIKYSLFYDAYKKNYWLFFLPTIVYMFAKGCVIAGANKHGLVQVAGQLIVESIMLGLLLWTRPYQLKSGRWINIVIHTVRVISVVCILVFVEELGIAQTTKTITGVILIVVQAVLTGVLAILIAVNALIICIKENPHRKKRKDAEKLHRDLDDLTPLDARNSLLMESMHHNTAYKGGMPVPGPFSDPKGRYDPVPHRSGSPTLTDTSQFTRPSRFNRDDDNEHLVSGAASIGHRDRSLSNSPPNRQPTLPHLDFQYGTAR